MIGKPEWFKRRKYSGWGLTPCTWQGWVYVVALILPILIIQSIPIGNIWKVVVIFVLAIIFCIDVIDIMIRMKKDERERIHEAIAERNALWAIVIVIAIGVAYESARSSILGAFHVDYFLIAALVVGLFVKIISNIYLDKTN